MAEATSTGTSFTLTEEGGDTLTLKGRALPYLPLSITGKQRAEFTWYPGSPSATVQMLGPEEGAITIRGYWKDKFLATSDDAKYGSNDITTVKMSSYALALDKTFTRSWSVGQIKTCASLVQVVDTMRRMGRRITLAWGSIIRIGHITSFTQTWYTPGYCEWEMEFSVAAQEAGAVQAVSSTPAATLDATTVEVAAAAAAFTGTLEQLTKQAGSPNTFKPQFTFLYPIIPETAELPPTNLLQDIYEWVGGVEDSVQSLINQLNDATSQATSVINQVNDVISAPGNITRSVIAALNDSATALSNSIGTVANTAITDVYDFFSVFGGQDAVAQGAQIAAAYIKRNVVDAGYGLARKCVVSAYFLEEQLQQNEVAQFIAPRNMDMRDISQQFYNTPNYWQQLMIYNGRTSSAVPAGTLIYVPNDPSYFGAGLPVGGTN